MLQPMGTYSYIILCVWGGMAITSSKSVCFSNASNDFIFPSSICKCWTRPLNTKMAEWNFCKSNKRYCVQLLFSKASVN